jgi:dihydrodipicolinate synthase/N-acetylneuraminate lyase
MKPTRKLLSAAATTLVIYVISRFTEVDEDLETVVNLCVPIIVAYMVPNDSTDTGDGVPA